MRRQFVAIGAVVVAGMLTACSSSVGVTPPAPAPLPTPAPTFEYSGRAVQTYTYFYGYPSQEPPATIVTRLKETVTALPTRHYPAGALDIHSDTLEKTALQSTHVVTNSYVSATAGSVLLYATTSKIESASGGQTTDAKTAYASPQIVSQKTGAWTNSPAASIRESYSDGHYQDRTVAADGTYDEKGTTFALTGQIAPITIREAATGAGRYIGPFDGCPPKTAFEFTAAPNIELKLVSKPPSSFCEMQPTKITDWYPASPGFFNEHDTAKNGAAPPSECGLDEKRVHLTTRTVMSLDTIIGYVEKTNMVIVNSESKDVLLCMLLTDSISNYYNWQGDTPYFFLFTPNGKPVSTIVTDEKLVIDDDSSARRNRNAFEAADAVAAGAQQQFLTGVARVRERLHDAMVRAFISKQTSIGGAR